MANSVMNIVMCSSDEYSVHCGTLIISILKNSQPDENFCFFIIESDISEEHKEKLKSLSDIKPFDINFISIDKEIFNKSCYNIDNKVLTGISIQTFYKYLIVDVLKDIDRALYLDIDMMVRGSLSEFYNSDLEGNYIAAVPDFGMPRTIKRLKTKLDLDEYFNAGVVLYDLKKCRENSIPQLLIENHIKMYHDNLITFADQCVINYTFKNKVKIVEKKYNAMYCKRHNKSYREAYENPVIIHYTTGRKPWNMYLNHKYSDEYFTYLPFSTFDEAQELYKKYHNPWYRFWCRITKK